jgi:hypothetical protein
MLSDNRLPMLEVTSTYRSERSTVHEFVLAGPTTSWS